MIIGLPVDPTDLGNMADYILQILHDSITKKYLDKFLLFRNESDFTPGCDCGPLSYVCSSQKEERPVLLGIGCLEFITEPESPLLLELQPSHCLPQGATIGTDDT